jgi:CrcB protein
VLRDAVPAGVAAALGTGFLGGYTTFSTASAETVRLLQHRRYVAAAVTSVAMLVLSVGACAAGMVLARTA